MMNKKQFAQEYREMQAQRAPDLWNRIEAGLESSPARQPEAAVRKSRPYRHFRSYGLAGAAALVLLITGVRLSGSEKGAEAPKQQPNNAVAEQAEAEVMAGAVTVKPVNALNIPENASTIAADASYFSEAVLAETELLCEASVTSVAFGEGESGRPDHVVYEMVIDGIYYAQGYVSEQETIEVTSPIVQAEADEAWLLYQMKPGSTYLVPLKAGTGGWELIYPFAPQIEVAADQTYIFHSGYSSLINQNTVVTKGEKEGESDFYYDRMLVRTDDNFLSDLISLVKQEVQGRK